MSSEKKEAPPTYPQSGQPELVQGEFKSGARFDKTTPPSIPPPPPGYAPNPIQVAAAEGKSIMMTNEKQDKWIGEDQKRQF